MFLLFVAVGCQNALVGHVAVELGHHLKGGVHAQHGDACVDGVDIAVSHELGDGTAAALVHLAQLAQLPDHFLLCKEPAQIGHQLGGSVTGAGLATGAGELADAHAVVDFGLAALLGHIGVQGIVGVADIGREAEALFYDDTKIKLFLQEANKYDCYTTNWGASKGLDRFQDVCIVLNKSTLSAYKMGRLNTIPPSTKNKLYVACTRAKGNIYLIPHTFIDKFKKG